MIQIICAKCGSPFVRRNGDCIWNTKKQDWEVIDLFDNCSCDNCGEDDVEILEIEYEESEIADGNTKEVA